MNAPDRAAWLAARRSGIGGSDIAAILGLSPYKTPLQLWMDKTGRAEDVAPDAAAEERMYWGTVLEDVVARHYAEERDFKLQRINQMLRHPDVPVALANIDRAVVVPNSRARWDDTARRVLGAERILEVKTAHAMASNSPEWGAPGTDEVPRHYWLQCLWYMGITGLPRADLAVLFGGQKSVVYNIEFDASLFEDILETAQDWWRAHVEADSPPAPSSEDDARRLWTAHIAGKEKIVDVNVAADVDELVAIKAQIKALEEKEQDLRDRILPAIGDAEVISYMGRRLATWKANKASQKTDWKSSFLDASKHIEAEIAALIRDNHTTTETGARVLRLSAGL